MHVPVALEALAAGLHVLLEKPFAPTLDDARRRSFARRDAAGRTLMISQNYRYHPAPRLATRARRQRCGRRCRGRRGRLPAPSDSDDAPWATRHRTMDHPLLADMAIHQFDLLRLVLGREPVWVEMEPMNPPSSDYRDPPAAFGLLSFEGDVPVSYRGSWISAGRPTPWGGEWRLEGADGAVEWTSRKERGAPDSLRLRTVSGAARPVELPKLRRSIGLARSPRSSRRSGPAPSRKRPVVATSRRWPWSIACDPIRDGASPRGTSRS